MLTPEESEASDCGGCRLATGVSGVLGAIEIAGAGSTTSSTAMLARSASGPIATTSKVKVPTEVGTPEICAEPSFFVWMLRPGGTDPLEDIDNADTSPE